MVFRFTLGLLAALAIALAGSASVAAGGGCLASTVSTEASGTAVAVSGTHGAPCGFTPTILRAPVGGTITWTNNEGLPHVVSGVGWGMANGTMLSNGTSYEHVFDTAGLYPYTCYLHPGMSGLVIVGDVAAAGTGATPVAAAPVKAAPAASAPVGSGAPIAYGVALLALGGALGYGLAWLRRTRPLAGELRTRPSSI